MDWQGKSVLFEEGASIPATNAFANWQRNRIPWGPVYIFTPRTIDKNRYHRLGGMRFRPTAQSIGLQHRTALCAARCWRLKGVACAVLPVALMPVSPAHGQTARTEVALIQP